MPVQFKGIQLGKTIMKINYSNITTLRFDNASNSNRENVAF